MQEISWKEWCDVKRNRDKTNQELAKSLKICRCKCGKIYSFNPSWQLDPEECAECRDDLGSCPQLGI